MNYLWHVYMDDGKKTLIKAKRARVGRNEKWLYLWEGVVNDLTSFYPVAMFKRKRVLVADIKHTIRDQGAKPLVEIYANRVKVSNG